MPEPKLIHLQADTKQCSHDVFRHASCVLLAFDTSTKYPTVRRRRFRLASYQTNIDLVVSSAAALNLQSIVQFVLAPVVRDF